MVRDLSLEAKQTFQVVGLLATMLVVGIHYKSDIPNVPSPSDSDWNELVQEFLFGGIARVAVPLFAFAAGFFYFRSDDGSLESYRRKLLQRVRTVLVPFFLIGSLAISAWMLAQQLGGKPIQWSFNEFLAMWLLHPPAEQLWFLRDLMVLVVLAPAVRLIATRPVGNFLLLPLVGIAWLSNWQFFPIIAGWRLLHLETLFFFSLGCFAVAHVRWIERLGRVSTPWLIVGWLIWSSLVVGRILIRADFDIWYVDVHGTTDLLLHQFSILVGCVVVFATAWRLRHPWLLQLSGGSFFVYLVHEFPLRAFAEKAFESFADPRYSCWFLTPIVIAGCYFTAVVMSRHCPGLLEIVTGGRMPSQLNTSSQRSDWSISPSPSGSP